MAELYANPRYLELADQIENHSRAIGFLLAELTKTFPPEGDRAWCVMGDHRPRLMAQA